LDQSNQTNKELLIAGSTIDIGPTLFDYLGVEIPTFWQGKSLLDEQNNKNTFILNSPNYFDANGTLQKLSEGSVDSEELYRIQKYIW
jgi:arylsulfatase A-like enzyme